MFCEHYPNWQLSRMAGIRKYVDPSFFKDKTLLELGCGYADIGNEFYKFGAIVTSSDARKEHIEVVRSRYPHLKTRVIDGDIIADLTGKYDVVVHWGLLYHLEEIENHIRAVSQMCDVLLLETEVADSENTDFELKIDEKGYDQAYNCVGVRPSPRRVEAALKSAGFRFELIKDPVLNSGMHIYDWNHENTGKWKNGLRRFWICWKPEAASPMRPDAAL
jgi:SAM-dependent methyltransferase